MTFHKYPKIKVIGSEENEGILDGELLMEEKIDGANFRFMIKEGRIIFGSRTQSMGNDKQEIGGNWKRCVEFIKENLDGKKLEEYEHKIFYGECCIKHTMSYNWDKIPPFLGFDIFCLKKDAFLGEKAELFEDLDLPQVPILKTIKGKDFKGITDDDIPQSKYSLDKAEGVVIKNYEKQIFAKYVREKFKEENRATFGGSKKYARNDSEYFVLSYCTNARIDKHMFKLIDDGHKLDMSLMKHLPMKVFEDIWEEEWKKIIHSRKVIDMSEMKKKVAKRCLNVLKQTIVNNSLVKEVEK